MDTVTCPQTPKRCDIVFAVGHVTVDEVPGDDDQVRIERIGPRYDLFGPCGWEQTADVKVGQLNQPIAIKFGRLSSDGNFYVV
ncbi:hypothetical protein [Rhizobium laguerreae]|uniref:hypothetical protein n=1 Tax=Rhizobium laguerreae TaxID=1076926 RepID=UPI001C91EDB9|nr:hypothetical protein [Rhizobium laguerreae]